MKYLLVLPILFILGGCSGISMVEQTRSKTVTTTHPNGTVVQAQEEVPLGNSQYDYQETQRMVAESAASVDRARAENVSKVIEHLQEKAETKNESLLAAVLGMLTLERMESSIPKSLEALGDRPMNGYEAIVEGLSKVASLGPTVGLTIAYREREKTAREVSRNAGTKIDVGGDGNTVDSRTTTVHSEIHANTTGDNSPTTVDNPQDAKGCPSGDCGATDVSMPSVSTLDECLAHPPGGYNQNGTPMFNSIDSCGSYFAE